MKDILRITHRLTIAATGIVLVACGNGAQPEGSASPMQVSPWAASMMGKKLSALFPLSTTCKGYADSVYARRVGPPANVEAGGWAWDIEAKAPIERVLFIDDSSTVIGAGTGGVSRPDVPKVLPEVNSEETGWSGVTTTANKVSAVAILAGGKACVIGAVAM